MGSGIFFFPVSDETLINFTRKPKSALEKDFAHQDKENMYFSEIL